jgi:hypothetical protein
MRSTNGLSPGRAVVGTAAKGVLRGAAAMESDDDLRADLARGVTSKRLAPRDAADRSLRLA